jgi:hypothetical protein
LNPDVAEASVEVTYYPGSGSPITQALTIPPLSRASVRVNDAAPALANADVGMYVHAIGGVPIGAERSMWWPSPDYYEAHLRGP